MSRRSMKKTVEFEYEFTEEELQLILREHIKSKEEASGRSNPDKIEVVFDVSQFLRGASITVIYKEFEEDV